MKLIGCYSAIKKEGVKLHSIGRASIIRVLYLMD